MSRKATDTRYVFFGEDPPPVPVAGHLLDLSRQKPSLESYRRNPDQDRRLLEVVESRRHDTCQTVSIWVSLVKHGATSA